MTIKSDLAKILDRHEKEIEAANQKLADAVRPIVIAYCDRRKFSFSSGQGDYYFFREGLLEEHSILPFRFDISSDFPSLHKALEYVFQGQQELGSYIGSYNYGE